MNNSQFKIQNSQWENCGHISVRIFVIVLLFTFLSTTAVFAKSSKDDEARVRDSLKTLELKNLQKEVDALARIRLSKADSLEKKEAEHWRRRYAEAQLGEEHQNTTRELDGRYSKLSTDLGRVTEELMASRNVTTEAEDKAKEDEIAYDAFHTQVKLSVDKLMGEVAGDYPVGMVERMANLQKAQAESDKKNPNTLTVLQLYVNDLLARHEKTYSESLTEENSQIGNRPDVPVTRLRLGTVFLGEVERNGTGVQALIRSGNLQGKIFEWNGNLPAEMNASIRTAIQTAGAEQKAYVPMDVLQNKAIKNAITDTKEMTLKEAFLDWFKKGGIVMYPLALAAFFALFLFFERLIVITRRGHLSRRFAKKMDRLVSEEKYEEAADLCLRHESSLSLVLFSVLNKARETREAAEKSLQESLLREQPKLERRMGLMAAIGTIAPLLGLLGTVTGIITLFTVITEVGTNDARVLAGGISEALITTEAGLIIAIPIMILHGLLSEKIERVISELYVQSTALLNRIFHEDEKA